MRNKPEGTCDSMKDVRLRKIRRDDREKIRHISIDVGIFTAEEVEVAISLVDEYFKGDRDYNFVVATLENKVIGYVCYGPTPLTSGTWDIYWVAVLREFHGRKIGSAMITKVENEIQRKGGRLILVETSSKKSYEPTRRFYEKMNYKIMSRIDKFYSEQDDLVTYGKHLNQNTF